MHAWKLLLIGVMLVIICVLILIFVPRRRKRSKTSLIISGLFDLFIGDLGFWLGEVLGFRGLGFIMGIVGLVMIIVSLNRLL